MKSPSNPVMKNMGTNANAVEIELGAFSRVFSLTGITQGRHHTQIRNCPWARLFNGVNATKKRTASPLGYAVSLCEGEFLFLQVRGAGLVESF